MDKRLEDTFYEGLLGVKMAEQQVKKEEPPAPKAITSRSLFSHPETHPVVLDLALLKHFNFEWFSWLPETLFFEIEKTFNTSIAEVNRLKILATQSLHVVDAFWEEWEIFEKTILSLNGIIPMTGLMQPPDLSLLYAGVDMANGIRIETFNNEIASYCAAVFMYENVHYAPEPLQFCQEVLSQPRYECKDCGKRGSALPPFDGLCSDCAGHYDHDKPFSFTPDPEKAGLGGNLTLTKLFDPADVKKRYEELDHQKDPGPHIREESADIQAAKLIIAMDYKNHRAQQLRDQLSSLRGWLEMA